MSKVKFRASYIQNQKNRIFEIIQSSQTQDNEGHFADKSEIPNGKVWWLYDRPLITRSCYCPFLVSCPLLSKVRSLNFIFSYLLLPFWQSVIKLGIAAQRTLVDYGNWILAKSFPRPMNSKHQGGEGWCHTSNTVQLIEFREWEEVIFLQGSVNLLLREVIVLLLLVQKKGRESLKVANLSIQRNGASTN